MVRSGNGAAARGDASAHGDPETDDVIEIAQAADADRFEITVNGERAGFAAYVDDGGRRIFHHTVVEDRFAGRGLAGRLVGHALARTAAAGLRIVPVCSYVAKYVATHAGDSAADRALDRVTPEALAAVSEAAAGPKSEAPSEQSGTVRSAVGKE